MSRYGAPVSLVNTHQVILDCNGQFVFLPAPQFENSEQLAFNRINSKTRGGDLILFRQNYWPKANALIMNFIIMDAQLRNRLGIFIRRNLGKLMTLTTHENEHFIGIIRNSDLEFVEQVSKQTSFKIEFEIE